MLNRETKALIDKISKADGKHTVAINVVFHITRVMLSIPNLNGIKEQNSREKKIDHFKKKKCNHMVLYHDGSHN